MLLLLLRNEIKKPQKQKNKKKVVEEEDDDGEIYAGLLYVHYVASIINWGEEVERQSRAGN